MSSHWNSHFKQFRQYLLLEKSLAEPSIEAYLHDLEALRKWSELRGMNRHPETFNLQDLMAFSAWLAEIGFSATSQARILSGIRGFYRFLVLQNEIQESPADFWNHPKPAANSQWCSARRKLTV